MTTWAASKPAVGLVMPLASQQGGAERLFQNLLHTQSHSFTYSCLFLQDGPMIEEARDLGYATAVVRTTKLRDIWNYVGTVQAIRQWMVTSHLDIVFSWMLKAHLYVAPAAVSLRTKRMWFQHGISKRHWMDLVGASFPTDAVLCCSGYVKGMQDLRLPSRATFVCHPGVAAPSAAVLVKKRARATLGLPVEGLVVCMVARLERWKGVHIFIAMAVILGPLLPDTTFVVAGGSHPMDQQYAEEMHGLGRKSKLGERLRIVGQRPANEIPLWHASADVVVHPVTQAEPFGMAIVEALAMGRAVVASAAGGISEIIEDGVSGVLVPPDDASALAEAVNGLLVDTDRRGRMEIAALTRAREFTIEAFMTRFESLLSTELST